VHLQTRRVTAGTLAAIAGLHVIWSRGSSFPFRSRDELADSVVGSDVVPSAAACNAVAVALFIASALVADVPVGPRRVRAVGRAGVATVLAARGLAGLTGRTDALSPGSNSSTFRRLDRRYYSPLCLALAYGAVRN
jgi:Protein of unknown function (DUF3995)